MPPPPSLNTNSFSREFAESVFAQIVTGWSTHLSPDGVWFNGPGRASYIDRNGSYEGITRMGWALGGWFSQPNRSPRLHGMDLDQHAQVVFGAGPHAWNQIARPRFIDQRNVEASAVAYAAYLSRDYAACNDSKSLSNFLIEFGKRPGRETIRSEIQRESKSLAKGLLGRGEITRHAARIVQLASCMLRGEYPWWSNWSLFWALNHAARARLGYDFDARLIESVFDYCESVHDGQGWFDDAPRRGAGHYDDYNNWVFAFYLLALRECGFERSSLTQGVTMQLQSFPYFFSRDGAVPEFGRSMCYRWARLAAPLMAYRQGLWPHSLGTLRSIVNRHFRWYWERGCLRSDGALNQPLTASGSFDTVDSYTGVGSAYNAMQFFGALWSLSDTDPFWGAEEAPMPVEREDFVHVIESPGWLLIGRGGHIDRFNAGSQKYPLRYGKFVYSTRGGNRMGSPDTETGSDSMLCLTDGETVGHRDAIDSFSVTSDRMETVWSQRIGRRNCRVVSCLTPTVDGHERIHIVTGARGLHAIESSECALQPNLVEITGIQGFSSAPSEIFESTGHFWAKESWRSVIRTPIDQDRIELRSRIHWKA